MKKIEEIIDQLTEKLVESVSGGWGTGGTTELTVDNKEFDVYINPSSTEVYVWDAKREKYCPNLGQLFAGRLRWQEIENLIEEYAEA